MKQQQKKSHKKLLLTLGLLFGLAGVGTAAFAGYVIADQNIANPDDFSPGEIKVVDESYDITASLSGEKLFFYPASESEEGNGKLTYTKEEGEESNLELTLTVTVDKAGQKNLENQYIKVSVSASGAGNAVDEGYITLPVTAYQLVGASVVFPLTFGWGTEFGGKDPVAFYSQDEQKDTSKDEILTKMNAFKEALPKTSITIKVEVSETNA